MSDQEEENEVIFIRSHHSDEDEDGGHGVWKLAYADFMTAMMAFFLVMWLINSTSVEVKASIVQYFNPVQLIDANPAHKGLRDPKDAGQGKSAQPTDAQDKPLPERSSSKGKIEPLQEAAALFYDPLATLEEIARAEPSAGAAGAAKPLPNQDALAFGNPFQRMKPLVESSGERGDNEDAVRAGAAISEGVEGNAAKSRQTPRTASPRANSTAARESNTSSAGEEETRPEPNSAASMRAALEKIVKLEAGGLRNVPHIEVAETNEGLLISLTDDANFSMFAIGSVKPKPQLVRIFGEIGRILAKMPGEIELRGHTDARSYKSGAYDNWRLSSDRANMALYMLVRGGLGENRVGKIVGYADRRLKTPKDPLADVNRRIEILLKRDEH